MAVFASIAAIYSTIPAHAAQAPIHKLDTNSSIQAQASAIAISGKPAVFLKNEKEAEEVMEKIKLQYVTKDQLNKLASLAKNTLPPLKKNEMRLLNVRLSENVTIQNESVAPDKIVPEVKAIALLLNGTLKEQQYVVKKGDVLSLIARKYNLKLAELLALNPTIKATSIIQIGQKINITVPKPYVHVIVEKEVNKNEPISYKNQFISQSSLPKGETKEKQKGKNGQRDVTYFISEQNGKLVKKVVKTQKVLQKPVNRIIIIGTKEIPSRGEGTFAWPTNGGYISSPMGYRWGRFHKGIDIARPNNLTIKAADNGVIIFAGWDGEFGNKIEIDHRNGFHTIYGHMSSLKVHVGQTVEKGGPIGIMGQTGDATGVHLHFEVHKNGVLKNPLSYLR